MKVVSVKVHHAEHGEGRFRFVKFKDEAERNAFIVALVKHLVQTPDFTCVALELPKGMDQAEAVMLMRRSKHRG